MVVLLCMALLSPSPEPIRGLRDVNGYRVLTLVGTPEERGRQHGVLLGDDVRRVVRDVVTDGAGAYDLDGLLDGAMVMERHLPDEYRRELHALAEAASVDYAQLVALQLFGDVRIAGACSSYAFFGPATRTGECLIGRNMDYSDYGVGSYAAILLHQVPDAGNEFMTASWAGVINGWTALNEHGLFCSNNIGFGADDASLEGVSTCFMVRHVVQHAATVAEGVELVRNTPRAIGTVLLIAGGSPADAAVVEYDHSNFAVRVPSNGCIATDNTLYALGREREEEPGTWSRAGTILELAAERFGRLDRCHNIAAAEGVPIRGINLHSALVFPADLTMYLSMGVSPAADQPYHGFRLTPRGVIGLDTRLDGRVPPA